MRGRDTKIISFTDLVAWQKGHELVLAVYALTKRFPNEEVYGLSSQMRRSAVSVTSNIAEGFGRSTLKDKRQFYMMALTSVAELQNQLLVARDVGYLDRKTFDSLAQDSVVVHKLINGLIKYTEKHDT